MDGALHVRSTFWLPEMGLFERARKDRVPYDVWHRDGYLTTTPGRTIEYDYVAEHIVALLEEHDLHVAFDRWNMRHLRPCLVRAGMSEADIDARFVEFGQGFQSMSPALRETESLLLGAKVRHGNHPVLSMCAANAVVTSNPAGGRKLDKSRARGRIDGMVALVMAASLAADDMGATPQYVEEDLLVL
jgi:phage terminase large subunit-like protein